MPERIEDRRCSDAYVQDMARYSIITNWRRNIPDLKDGLKPVQRRIVYAMMHDEHAVSVGSKVKCASIIGTVMKNYHPHSDCLHPDTPVYGLSGKIYTIGELYSNNVQSLEILSVDQKTGNIVPAIAHSFRIGQYTDKIYHIILSNGIEIKCTGNHPFLTADMNWIRAENISPDTRLWMDNINFDGRPSIGSNLVQDIVYDYYNGHIPNGCVKHHKDGDYYNNTITNFDQMSRAEHALHHKDYATGLENGRHAMFDSDGIYREETKQKNSTLSKEFNKEQGIRRFKFAIKTLKNRGLAINETNYESLRGEIYNLPYVNRLIAKGYGGSFKDLVDLELPTVGELYHANKKENLISFNGQQDLVDFKKGWNGLFIFYFGKTIETMMRNNESLTFQNYEKYTQKGGKLYTVSDEYIFNIMLSDYFRTHPVIINITIELVNQEPMFDFTVDGYENMIIPAIKPGDTLVGDVPFICAHNSSIYDAMKPLANWFECKMPLIRPGGSFGNIMGGSASAPRYTEANLTPFALECVLSGLSTSNALVDWVDNYDNKRKEPEYLPATVPLLLVNGMMGMGVGLSVDLPQHNLGEVIDATLRLMDNPNAPVVLIPDHCIPCEIIDTDWKTICNSGSGSYRARGFIDIEEGKSGPVIIIKSIPTYNTSVVYRQLNELIKKGKFPQITRVRDESAKGVIRIVINLRKGSDASFVKEAIYKYTRCEDSFRINFEVIEGIELMRMSYKGYLEAFIQFAMTNKFRYCYNQLTTINTRMHKLEAFIKVLRSGYIDDIIKMIRKRKESDDNSIIEFIITKAGVTDLQASFIINANIKNLSLGYLLKYETEYKALKEQMLHYEAFVSNDDLIKNSVRQDLLDAKAKYATPRLCKVIKASSVGNIPQGSFKVIITENNYIRKIGVNDIVNVVRGDKPKFIMDVENTENVLLFDNKGRVFKLPVHKVPIIGKSDPGFDIKTIIRGLTADIICMMYEPWLKNTTKIKQKFYLSIITRHNVIKKLDINDFLSVPPSGIIYSKLNMDDTVISIQIISDQLDVVIYSGHKALRMSAKEIPCYKRNTLGIAAMNTNDPIEGMSIIYPEATDIVVATVSGKFNRFLASGLTRSNRNKAGSSVIKLAKGDRIQSIYGVSELNMLEVTTTSDVFRIPINTIQSGSSVSPGVKMISTKSDTIIRAQVVS